MPENMNAGKTHAFFSWAAENATVPHWEYPAFRRSVEGSTPNERSKAPVWRGEKPPAYVVKADEDSFIMLGELERRLRVAPRTKAYWGCMSSILLIDQADVNRPREEPIHGWRVLRSLLRFSPVHRRLACPAYDDSREGG